MVLEKELKKTVRDTTAPVKERLVMVAMDRVWFLSSSPALPLGGPDQLFYINTGHVEENK